MSTPVPAAGLGAHTMTEETEIDSWLRILANEQRRAVISYLRENGEASLAELAKHVTVSTADPRRGAPSPPEFDRTMTALYHVHLPLMDDVGVVDWNHEEKHVRVANVPENAPTEIGV